MTSVAYIGGILVTYLTARYISRDEPDIYNSFGLLAICSLLWPLFWAAVVLHWAYSQITEKV